MGELTQANAERIDWRLESYRLRRRKGEMAFLLVVCSVLMFTMGYVAGMRGWLRQETPDWAEKLGNTHRAHRSAPPPSEAETR